MSILNSATNQNRIVLTYKDKEIMSPLMSYIDELISEHAINTNDGLSLNVLDLSDDERNHIHDLAKYYCSMQELINARCDEKNQYLHDTRGFND